MGKKILVFSYMFNGKNTLKKDTFLPITFLLFGVEQKGNMF